MDRASFESMSDEALAEHTLTNPDVYEYLIVRYKQKLYRYVKRITRSHEDDTEDILQEVFIKAYRNIAEFDTRLKFSSWIYRIAHNEAITFVRKSSRIKRNEVSSDAPPPGGDTEEEPLYDRFGIPATQGDDFDEAINKKNVGNILSLLKPKYRDVLILRYIEGKEYKEISDILRKSPGTVATLINRAKKEFIKKSKSEHVTFSHDNN